MFMREFVHLLWIIEGPKFMRAHAGNIFFYHPDGAFVPYRGAWYLVAKYLSHVRYAMRVVDELWHGERQVGKRVVV
jgi:hypothetical protein